MEGKTHYERIIGGTEKEKKDAHRTLQKTFDERNEKIAKYELEKTPEDLELIQKTENIVGSIVTGYKGDPKPTPIDHIYILKQGDVFLASDKRFRGGFHQPFGENVIIEKQKSKLLFVSTLAHELFHLKSYKAARVGKSTEQIHLYRSGFSMFDRKNIDAAETGDEKEYFAILEEAIVAQCAQNFLEIAEKDEMFRKESEASKKIIEWVLAFYRRNGMPEEQATEFIDELKYIDGAEDKVKAILDFSDDENKRQAYAAGMFKAMYEKGDVIMHERYNERKRLQKLLGEIVEKSNGKFKDIDEVFDEFAKANFSGNYLPLARIIEDIFGKGSFRKLAEEFSPTPA
jgi:hypothetical protein